MTSWRFGPKSKVSLCPWSVSPRLSRASALVRARFEAQLIAFPTLVDGPYLLTVHVADGAANRTSQSTAIVVDTTGPTRSTKAWT